MDIDTDDLQRAAERLRRMFGHAVCLTIDVWASYAPARPARVSFRAWCDVEPPLAHIEGESPDQAMANLEHVLQAHRLMRSEKTS